jgi:hypothetical protein
MNRKWIALLLSCALVLMLAAACGRNNDKTNNNANDTTNNGMNNGTTNNGSDMNTRPDNSGNTNVPGDMTPGNDLNGSDGNIGEHNEPVFPDSLATMDADVAVADLFDTIGLSETDLDNAMRDVATVGDGVNGARTYRHKLLGRESDVSYGFDDQRAINKVTVKSPADSADEWREELSGTLGATEVEGQMNNWTYNEHKIKVDDKGDHVLITIQKDA